MSPEGGWTMLVTYPKRPTCVVAMGEAWEEQLAGDPPDRPSRSRRALQAVSPAGTAIAIDAARPVATLTVWAATGHRPI